MLNIDCPTTQPWNFVTFAAGSGFKASGTRLVNEAENSELFVSCKLYTELDLKRLGEFWDKHQVFFEDIKNNRGYGLWLWKPAIILDVFHNSNRGEGILYLDAGSHLNLRRGKSVQVMHRYLETARNKGALAFEAGENFLEKLYTHPTLIQSMSLEELNLNSPQIEAGALFLINSIENEEFLREWLDWMTKEDYRFLRSQNFFHEGLNRFTREDQSVMSCLYKKRSMYFLPNQTYSYPCWSWKGRSYPIWHTRERSGRRILKNPVTILFRNVLNHLVGFISNKLRKFSSR